MQDAFAICFLIVTMIWNTSANSVNGIDEDTSVDSGESQYRIIGGRPANLSEIPFQALMTLSKFDGSSIYELRCGGSIYNSKWIITAAHCFFDGLYEMILYNRFKISVGKRNLRHHDEGEQSFEVIRVMIHPEYDPHDNDFNHDIALVRLKKDIAFTKTIKPIAIPSINYVPSGKNNFPSFEIQGKATVSGWGYTKQRKLDSPYESSASVAEYLQVVALDIIPQDKCLQQFEKFNSSSAYQGKPSSTTILKPGKNHICAYRKDKDSCQGDSGGPLTCTEGGKLVLCGIVSYGLGCALELAGLYTHVANYYCWILQNAGDSEGKEVKNLGSICKTKLKARWIW